MREIYLDNSATTRPYDEVIELMADIQKRCYGNPSSIHRKSLEAERLLKEARHRIARALGARDDEVLFASGGTEANNLAIKGAAYRHRRRGTHLVTTAVEHPSVLNSFRQLENEGFTVTYLPVDKLGLLSLDDLERALQASTTLVSINHVNSESGAVMPAAQIGRIIKRRHAGTLYHVDGVQSFCKIETDPASWQADLFTCSSHKLHGPKGAGALWVKRGTLLKALLEGGDQEQRLRPGTENTPAIAGFGLAAELTAERRQQNAGLMYNLKERLFNGLRQAGVKVELNGPPLRESAPHIINLSFSGVKAELLLHSLEEHGIYTSPGSACHSRRPEPSHVLLAMGLGEERLQSALRFSFSPLNTAEEIDLVITHTAAAVRDLSRLPA